MTDLHAIPFTTIDGEPASLADYAGHAVLVVNVASECGLTPQFEGLESLYRDLQEEGLVVLGFPSNQFKQELGSADEIAEACQRNYGVTFPMFEMVDVNGSAAHPIFQWLKGEKKGMLGSAIKWNFTKFLIGRDGAVIERFAPTATPEDLRADVERALAA